MFIFQLFDTKNTCIEMENPLAKTVSVSREIAKRLSMKYVKVILIDGDWFEQYEKGIKTEWSA